MSTQNAPRKTQAELLVELHQISTRSPGPLTVNDIGFIDQTIRDMPSVPRTLFTTTVRPHIQFQLKYQKWYHKDECQVETGAGGECGATSVMVAFVAKNIDKPSSHNLVQKIRTMNSRTFKHIQGNWIVDKPWFKLAQKFLNWGITETDIEYYANDSHKFEQTITTTCVKLVIQVAWYLAENRKPEYKWKKTRDETNNNEMLGEWVVQFF